MTVDIIHEVIHAIMITIDLQFLQDLRFQTNSNCSFIKWSNFALLIYFMVFGGCRYTEGDVLFHN